MNTTLYITKTLSFLIHHYFKISNKKILELPLIKKSQ